MKKYLNWITLFFSVLSSIGLVFLTIGLARLTNHLNNGEMTSSILKDMHGLLIFGILITIFSGIGSFCFGAMQFLNVMDTGKNPLLIAASICNILLGLFFVGPILSIIGILIIKNKSTKN